MLAIIASMGVVGIASYAIAQQAGTDNNRESYEPGHDFESQEQAQERLDPEQDPEVLLHQLEDGTWTVMTVTYLGELPTEIKTTEDFTRFDIEGQVEEGELPPDTNIDEQVATQQAELSCVVESLRRGVSSEDLVQQCIGSQGGE